jgi:hypothetical protein
MAHKINSLNGEDGIKLESGHKNLFYIYQKIFSLKRRVNSKKGRLQLRRFVDGLCANGFCSYISDETLLEMIQQVNQERFAPVRHEHFSGRINPSHAIPGAT